MLSGLRAAVRKGLAEDDLVQFYSAWEGSLDVLASKIAPDAADFILMLDEKQMHNFVEKSAEARKKRQDSRQGRERTPSERKASSAARFLSYLYSDLDDSQVEMLRRYIESSNYISTGYNSGYQEIMQKRLASYAAQHAPKDDVAAFIKNWTARSSSSMTAEEYKKLQDERKFNIRLYVYADRNVILPEQRTKAVSNIDYYIKTIDELIEGK